MPTTLSELLRHNRWANDRIIDACAAASDADLDAATPGTYGSARDTLVHLVAAEGRYVAELHGTPPADTVNERLGFPGFDRLRAHARATGDALVDFAEKVTLADELRGTYQGRAFVMPTIVPLLQAVNHATEHRAHIMTALSLRGIAPPVLDGWTYWESGEVTQPP